LYGTHPLHLLLLLAERFYVAENIAITRLLPQQQKSLEVSVLSTPKPRKIATKHIYEQLAQFNNKRITM